MCVDRTNSYSSFRIFLHSSNIRVQTMEGRIQKAREGKWNGGFAPYGYKLVDGKLIINEEEAVAIRIIFDQYRGRAAFQKYRWSVPYQNI